MKGSATLKGAWCITCAPKQAGRTRSHADGLARLQAAAERQGGVACRRPTPSWTRATSSSALLATPGRRWVPRCFGANGVHGARRPRAAPARSVPTACGCCRRSRPPRAESVWRASIGAWPMTTGFGARAAMNGTRRRPRPCEVSGAGPASLTMLGWASRRCAQSPTSEAGLPVGRVCQLPFKAGVAMPPWARVACQCWQRPAPAKLVPNVRLPGSNAATAQAQALLGRVTGRARFQVGATRPVLRPDEGVAGRDLTPARTVFRHP